MFFDFVFKVPLLRNPFAASPLPQSHPPQPQPQPSARVDRPRPIHRPELLAQQPLSGWVDTSLLVPSSHKRRRGWEPADSSVRGLAPPLISRSPSKGLISPSIPNFAFSNAQVRGSSSSNTSTDEEEDELPAAKRRRIGGITDTLLTSALNVALVGTAVGITAYRLWRDRGKAEESPIVEQPPPYEAADWDASSCYIVDRPDSPSLSASSSKGPLPSRKRARNIPNRSHGSIHRRSAKPIFQPSSPGRHVPPPQPSHDVEEELGMESGELDEQMDWMSAQLQALINEGQKALGKEVVIGIDSNRDEDLVDDGDEGWEDDDPRYRSSDRGRAGRSQPSISPVRRARRVTQSPSKRPGHRHTNSATLSTSTSTYPSHSRNSSRIFGTQPLDDLYTTAYTPGDEEGRSGSPDLHMAMDRVRRAYGLPQ